MQQPRRTVRVSLASFVIAVVLLTGCSNGASPSTINPPETVAPAAPSSTSLPLAPAPPISDRVERLTAEIIEQREHDPEVFTQGLELYDGSLFQTSGLYGQSTISRIDPQTAAIEQRASLDSGLFAEGLTIVDDQVVVLTWRERTALVLDATTLEERDRHRYDGEGWGLCDDGTRLVMSNGSSTLQFRDRRTFDPLGSIEVTLEGQAVIDLNELECAQGSVWANVWHDDSILRIDPSTGRVTAVVDASTLAPPSTRDDPEAVLNGIAYDDATDTFLVTGKRWPALFVVRFVPAR